MIDLSLFLFIGAALILLSVLIARLVDNIGIPTLLLFLGIGILANSEGILEFGVRTPYLTQSIALIALIFIIFSGGLETPWRQVRPIVAHGISLATVGVIITACVVAVATWKILGYSLFEGLLLGSIISSTDAPAVFSVLRSKKLSLTGNLKSLLEFESGSNDPTAIFLTLSFITAITTGVVDIGAMIFRFFLQMALGVAFGLLLGKALVSLLNNIRFSYEGFYPVTVLAGVIGIYGATVLVEGNGILAVYLAGIVIGNSDVVQKRSLLRFFDGLAWLSQITMFLSLGFLIAPAEILAHTYEGFIISMFLIIVARPVGVFFSLLPSGFSWRERLFLSWVGIRGAMPIILATFLLTENLPLSGPFLRIVFFVVLSSALLQGWSIPFVARFLRVDAPLLPLRRVPLEFETPHGSETELLDFIVPYNSPAINKPIVEIGLPKDSLIVLIIRNERFVIPSGGTVLEAGDTLLALVNRNTLEEFRVAIAGSVISATPTT